MKCRMSPNVAVRTRRFSDAIDFYSNVLGFANRSSDPALGDHDADPLNLFVIEDGEVRGPVMELFVQDLEGAREELLAHGCEVIRWRGKGQDCYIRDPFGVIFNLWEKPLAEQLTDLVTRGLVKFHTAHKLTREASTGLLRAMAASTTPR